MALYLGIDGAADAISATVIDSMARRVVFSRSISTAGNTAALDAILQRLAMAAEIDVDGIRAIAVSHTSGHLLTSLSENGRLAATWRKRLDLPDAPVLPPSGMCATAIALGAVSESVAGITFGTNDVVHTLHTEVVLRNGSLTRDWVRRQYGLDWNAVAAILESAPATDDTMMLPWLEAEVTPAVRFAGLRRFGFDAHDVDRNIRGVIEGQMMALANHCPAPNPARIVATGAEASRRDMLQVLADVFGADVYRLDVQHPASLGEALRAFHDDRLAAGEPLTWPSVVSGFADPHAGHRVSPNPKHVAMYAERRRDYAMLERVHRDRRPICA